MQRCIGSIRLSVTPNGGCPNNTIDPISTCTREDSPFHPYPARPQFSYHCFNAGRYRFCAIMRLNRKSRYPGCPSSRPIPFTGIRVSGRWGDFPQTRRPGNCPPSLTKPLIHRIYRNTYRNGFFIFLFRVNIQGNRVYAKMLSGRGRSIIKNMAQVPSTTAAYHFDAFHSQGIVRYSFNVVF